MIQFSLIIPTYNEAKNISVLVPRIIKLLSDHSITFEIIVVDDDSPDLTWKVAQEIAKKDSRVSAIRRIQKKGLSSAVLDGMEVANGQSFGVIDADMQHDENILPRMISELKDYEMVVGSRVVEEGGYGEWGLIRKTMSKIATLMAKLFLPISIGDPMSGYFVLRRELYEEIASEVNPIGFKILLEFIARKKGIKVKEVGYVFKTRIHGETKMTGSVIQNYLIALYDIRFGKYVSLTFIRYGVTGFLGVFVNLFGQFIAAELLGWKGSGEVYSNFLLPSLGVVFGFELAVLSNYILNNLWTFKKVKKKGILKNITGFLKFNLVSYAGLVIQLSVWRFTLEAYQVYLPEYYFSSATYICNFIGILLATAGNYHLNKHFTWTYKE
ncbi:MAG: glycosyltransferase family 2 protein [Leptospiraceae bacterium]|nr:glycosyltransferase family 2 protein [Leptospiraceae bacterium]MCP5496330.1 glycosyltransferase family 2 protein [Leptospiraceae bacterium]